MSDRSLEDDRTFEEFEAGEVFHCTEGRTITESDIRMYIGATDETAPEHVDHEYADQHPLIDGVVAQGTLVLGVANSFVARSVTQTSAFALNYGYERLRFTEPVYPGDTLTGTIVVEDKLNEGDQWGDILLGVTVVNQHDEDVLVGENRLKVCKETVDIDIE